MMYNTNILGWMHIRDLDILSQLSSTVPQNGTIVEIGSLFGRSSVCLAMSADSSVRIQCIDRFPEISINNHGHPNDMAEKYGWPLSGVRYNSREQFLRNTAEFSNVEMIIGDSPYKIPNYKCPESIDMLFIDSDHTNPGDWDNLRYFVPHVRTGGLIVGHDYNSLFPDIIDNVRRLEQLLETTVILTPGSTIWYMYINKKVETL